MAFVWEVRTEVATDALGNKNTKTTIVLSGRQQRGEKKTAGTGDKRRQNYGKAIFNSSPAVFPRCVTPRAELNIDLFCLLV